MTDPQRHDWPKIIAEIHGRDVSLYKLSIMMGVHHTQVKRWAAGKGRGPLHHDGQVLLAIHSEYVR